MPVWPDDVNDLVLLDFALVKLGRRGISNTEARQLLRNKTHLRANRKAGRSRPGRPRFLLIGTTDGGRFLALVVESTRELGTWLVITGWDSDRNERRLLRHG